MGKGHNGGWYPPLAPDSDKLVFLADDDPAVSALVSRWLELAGYETCVFSSGEACFEALFEDDPAVVLLDVEFPGQSGLEVLDLIRSHHPHLPVIMLTGDEKVETVVRAMRCGAFDYLTKPLDQSRLLTTLHNATEQLRLSTRVAQLEREVAGGYAGIIGNSAAMKQVFRQIDRLSRSDVTVLVRGESGTGKELIACALHDSGARARGPFVAVNSAAIPEPLLESELFGHERGAFTGAVDRRIGKFEEANRGTIFLDEIGELSPAVQARLLRVLQERTFRRLGGSATLKSDFRLLSATHRNLAKEVEDGRFREDLYFRLAVFDLEIPPLRKRAEDIPAIALHFMRQYAGISQSSAHGISAAALQMLTSWSWPGNVRELQNVIQRALVVADGTDLQPRDLPEKMRGAAGATYVPGASEGVGAESGTLEDASRNLMLRALERYAGNASAVMRELNIGRARFYRMLRKYDLESRIDEFRQAKESGSGRG